MSQGSIGRGALVLTTDSGGLFSGLNKAASGIKGFASKVGGALTSFKGLAAAGGIALGVREIVGELTELGKVGQTATAFGIDPKTFSGMAGLAKSAGSDIRDFTEALTTMSGRADEAGKGGIIAAEMFQKLGLNAGEFKKLGVDEQFYQIFESLQKVQNPAERVGILMKAFGEDSAKNLIPLLGKSSEELKGMAGGFALSAEEMERVAKANTQLRAAGTAVQGLWRKIVVAVAPVVEIAANGLSRLVTLVGPVFDWTGRAIEKFVSLVRPVFDRVGRWVTDVLSWIERAAEAFIAVVGPAFDELMGLITGIASDVWNWLGGLLEPVGKIVSEVWEWIGATTGLGGSWSKLEDVVTKALKYIGIAGSYAWEVLKVGVGGVTYALSYLVDGFALVVKSIRELLKVAGELPGQAGATFRDAARRTDQFATSVNGAADRMRVWGERQMNTKFGENAAMVEAWFNRLLTKKKQVEQIAPKVAAPQLAEFKPTSALISGSKDELSARIKAEFGSKAQDQQLAEQKKANNFLKGLGETAKAIAEKIAPLPIAGVI